MPACSIMLIVTTQFLNKYYFSKIVFITRIGQGSYDKFYSDKSIV